MADAKNISELPIVLAAAARGIAGIIERRSDSRRGDKRIAFDVIRLAAFRHVQAQRDIAALTEPTDVAEARAALASGALDALPGIAQVTRKLVAEFDAERARLTALYSAEIFSDDEIAAAMERARERVSKPARTDYQRAAWAAFERAEREGVDIGDPRVLGLLSFLVA